MKLSKFLSILQKSFILAGFIIIMLIIISMVLFNIYSARNARVTRDSDTALPDGVSGEVIETGDNEDQDDPIPYVYNKQLIDLLNKKPYTVRVRNDSFNEISINNYAEVVKIIRLKDIPVFDAGCEGDCVPELDYRFDYIGEDAEVYNPLYQEVYFTVTNATTAGNANRSYAMFAYNLVDKSMRMVFKSYGTGGAPVTLSNDGKILLIREGQHGGACNNPVGIVIVDVIRNKKLDNVYSEIESGQTNIEFKEWTAPRAFSYTEAYFEDDQLCIAGDDPTVVTGEYIIK